MSLSIIKNSFFNGSDNFQLNNRFSVFMSLRDPKRSEFRVMAGEPAISVELSSTSSIGAPFRFQNIPLTIPTKFQGGNNQSQQLSITFYMRESLNVFNTLQNLIKQYGGDPIFTSNVNRPTSYYGPRGSGFADSTLYNQAIRQNIAKIFLFDELNTKNTARFIQFYSIYPTSILPISFNSRGSTDVTPLTVFFNYAYAQSWNETELGGPFGSNSNVPI